MIYEQRNLNKIATAIWISSGILFCFSSDIFAESSVNPPIVQEINLQTLVKSAFIKSPALKSKKARYDSLRAKVVEAWLPMDPMFGIDVEGQPQFFKTESRMNYEYMVSQSIPFPTKLLLRGIAASKEADMAYQEFKEEERKVIWNVEQPYYSLFLAKKTVEALEETKILLEQFSRAVRSRYESGQASQIDNLKVGIELSQVKVELFEWKQKVNVTSAEVSRQLNQSLDMVYEVGSDLTKEGYQYSRSELEAAAIEKKPELQMFKVAVEKTKTEGLLTKTDWLPDIIGRIEIRDFREEGMEREYDNFIGFSVPVWSLIKGVGGTWRGADAEVRAAEALYIDMRNETLLGVRRAYARMESAKFARETFEKETIPQARQQVEVALTAYESGKENILMLIDAQRTLKNLQIQYYKALAEYEMGLSDLGLAVGEEI